MLQECVYTGIFFLVGIFYGSVLMGIALILATFCGTLTAHLLHYDDEDIARGLYGFNAALVGVALCLFIENSFWLWLLIIIGALLSTIIQHFFLLKHIQVYTLPFVLTSWFLIWTGQIIAPLVSNPGTSILSGASLELLFPLRAFGQVIFQENWISGFLFFIGVFLSSRRAALFGLTAALIAGLIAFLMGTGITAINQGLLSFNAVLCAIAINDKGKSTFLLAIGAIIISVLLSLLFLRLSLIQLTFPFVVATVICLYFNKKTAYNK